MIKMVFNSFWFSEAKSKLLVQGLMFLLFLFGVNSLQAQSKHYFSGKMYIDTAGFVYISTHDTMSLQGKITTVREITEVKRGMLSFSGTSDWKSSNGSFVNGYVRSHKPDAFVFPVGQGIYRPAAISKSADAAPTDVAYHNKAQYDKNALDAEVHAITDESWYIIGTTAAEITLSWNSDISSLATSLTKIGIAGWDGTKWVKVPSTLDPVTSIFGMPVTSTLTGAGSVTTLSEIAPNTYFAYTLAIVDCPEVPCEVKLDLTVFLEGVMRSDGTMNNYLQGPSRHPELIPAKALPVQNPYTGMPEFYHQINDTLGTAGKVVDWILLEVWANFDTIVEDEIEYTFYDLVESQALLLKPDGRVVDTNGSNPRFKYYTTDSVRIVIKHRNHLSVLSSIMLSFDSNLKYDFSEGVTQAVKIPGARYQPMVLRQGKACLWAGDIWNGTSADGTRNIINNLDITRHYVPMRSTTGYLVGSYMFEDVNMDGIIDDGDSAFVIYNGKQNTQSPLYFCIKRP